VLRTPLLSGGAPKLGDDGIERLRLRARRASSERKDGIVGTIGSRFPSDRGPYNIELELSAELTVTTVGEVS
jgi:hypothetical protein